jgi:hypothetical protein
MYIVPLYRRTSSRWTKIFSPREAPEVVNAALAKAKENPAVKLRRTRAVAIPSEAQATTSTTEKAAEVYKPGALVYGLFPLANRRCAGRATAASTAYQIRRTS